MRENKFLRTLGTIGAHQNGAMQEFINQSRPSSFFPPARLTSQIVIEPLAINTLLNAPISSPKISF
jgi:hypothetical protein